MQKEKILHLSVILRVGVWRKNKSLFGMPLEPHWSRWFKPIVSSPPVQLTADAKSGRGQMMLKSLVFISMHVGHLN